MNSNTFTSFLNYSFNISGTIPLKGNRPILNVEDELTAIVKDISSK